MGRWLLRAAGAAFALLAAAGVVSAQPLPRSVQLQPGVTLEITSLKRLTDKGAMELRFAIANGGTTPTSAKDLGLATAYRLDEIVLIDFAGKRSYNIGTASRCLCSTFGDGGAVAPGAKREFWAWFGLPDANAKTLGLQVAGQPPIGDLPLE